MTIAAAPSYSLGLGNGVLTTFGYTFPIFTTDGSDIQVWILDNLGNSYLLSGNYSVNVGASQVNFPLVGGVFPLGVGVMALPTGWTIVIMRVEPLAQNMVLTNNGSFDGPSIMAAFDKIYAIFQQMQEQLNRCYKTPPGTAPSSTVTPNVAPQQPFNFGTYAYLKGLAQANPAVPFIGLATDLAEPGTYTMMFYTGNPNVGDAGFVEP